MLSRSSVYGARPGQSQKPNFRVFFNRPVLPERYEIKAFENSFIGYISPLDNENAFLFKSNECLFEKSAKEYKSKEQITNQNPILSWSELLKELETPNVSADTISKAVRRSISQEHKRVSTPWAIGGCASGYQIVDDQVKDNKEHPTPASCKYQKIAID